MLEGLEGGVRADLEKRPNRGYQNTGCHSAAANGNMNDAFKHLKGFMNDYIALKLHSFQLTHSLSSPIDTLEACM